jgi:hypothetical protein
MRRFLIRAAQAFTLAIIGTGFIADTSHAKPTREDQKKFCDAIGGQFFQEWNPKTNSFVGGKYSCTYTPPAITGGGTNFLNCTANDRCSLRVCPKGERCYTISPPKDAGKKPTTVSAGTIADRYGRTPAAPTSGAALTGGLNAVAPSQTAPAVSTGAALKTQAVTGLTGIDKPAAIPSQLSDRLNRMRQFK